MEINRIHRNPKETIGELALRNQNIAVLKEMRQYRNMTIGSYISMLRGIEAGASTFKNLHQQILAVSNSFSYLRTSCAKNILSANLEIGTIFSSLKPYKSVIEQLRSSQAELAKTLGSLSQITNVKTLFPKDFYLITHSSILAQQVLASNSFEMFFKTIEQAGKAGIAFKKDFIGLTDSYKSYWNSFNSDIQKLLSLSPLMFKMPTVEMYLATRTLDFGAKTDILKKEAELTESEVNEIINPKEQVFNKLISSVDVGLIKLYRGAKEAIVSQGTDKIRHVTVSLRELVTHVLHKLSPDEEILKWNNDPSNIVNGRPTRKTRLLFICRNINHDDFLNFVNKDISSTISFLDLLQEGTHAINANYDDKQLEALVLRVESLLIFLINISSGTVS